MSHEKSVKKNYKINESEVTPASIQKMNIELILAHIAQYEQAIEAGDLDIDTVQMLSKLYQKGIEYFSALDDTMFGDLLNRMQSLL